MAYVDNAIGFMRAIWRKNTQASVERLFCFFTTKFYSDGYGYSEI